MNQIKTSTKWRKNNEKILTLSRSTHKSLTSYASMDADTPTCEQHLPRRNAPRTPHFFSHSSLLFGSHNVDLMTTSSRHSCAAEAGMLESKASAMVDSAKMLPWSRPDRKGLLRFFIIESFWDRYCIMKRSNIVLWNDQTLFGLMIQRAAWVLWFMILAERGDVKMWPDAEEVISFRVNSWEWWLLNLFRAEKSAINWQWW